KIKKPKILYLMGIISNVEKLGSEEVYFNQYIEKSSVDLEDPVFILLRTEGKNKEQIIKKLIHDLKHPIKIDLPTPSSILNESEKTIHPEAFHIDIVKGKKDALLKEKKYHQLIFYL